MEIYGINAFPKYNLGGIIKDKPEDFIVEEIDLSGKLHSVKSSIFEKIKDFFPQKFDEYLHLTLIKRNYTTQRAISELSKKLRISQSRFGFAGTKDKKAFTSQRISIWNVKIEDVRKIKLKDIILKEFKYSKQKIKLGDLKANRFTIKIKDIEKENIRTILNDFKEQIQRGIPNFFGPQRFGFQRPINHLIGKEILKNNFEEAVKLFLTYPGDENLQAKEARNFLKENWRDWKNALKKMPLNLSLEKNLLNYLIIHPNDFKGTLLRFPPNLLKMFIHAYQSFIFNKLLSEALETKILPKELPLIGHRTFLNENNRKIVNEILSKDGLSLRNFEMKELPLLSEKGSKRETIISVEKFKILKIKDKEVILQFELPKGSYATILIYLLTGNYTKEE